MALVVNFGNNTVVTRVSSDTGNLQSLGSERLGEKTDFTFLSDYERVKSFMSSLLSRFPETSTSYIAFTVSVGSGIVYRNLNIAKSTLGDYAPNATQAEKEEHIYRLLEKNLYSGFEEKYGKFYPCVLASREDEEDAVLSVAYVPRIVVDNLTKVAAELNLVLATVSPMAYGIYNVLDDLGKQLVLDMRSSVATLGNDGIMVWEKPKNNSYSLDMVTGYFIDEIRKVYGKDVSNTVEMINGSERNYLVSGVEIPEGSPMQGYAAIGCLMGYKGGRSSSGKDGEGNAADSLRKLFKKK